MNGSVEPDDPRSRYPGSVAFRFGDGAALCASLTALVREGRKTATCGALRDFTDGDEELPVVGRRDIVLNWDGTPALVIETLAVEHRRFRDVDEAFALLEGENDSLEGWRADHRAYFERNGGFDDEMMLVCERFRLIEDLERPTGKARTHMAPVAVLIHVPDVRAGLAWYARAFPSSRVSRDATDELAILSVDGFDLEIVRTDAKAPNGKGGSVLYWAVPSLEEALERLSGLGATPYRGPMSIEGGLGMCQVEDPFGNLIGLRGRIDADG